MKHLIGKQVWLMPTGNNSRYDNKLVEVKIVKVGRVNVTFVREDWNREEVCRLDDYKFEGRLELSCGHNSGWVVFESIDDFKSYKELSELRSKLTRHIRDRGLGCVGIESLREISRLLGLDKQEKK